MQLSNRILGIAAIIGASAIVYGTFGFRTVPGQQFGSAFFPRIIAGCLGLTGLLLLIGASRGPWITVPDWMRSTRGLRALALPAGGVAWLMLAPTLGFILATALLILGLITVIGGRLMPALAVSAGLSLLLHLIFGVLLRIPLPFGVVEGWLV